MKSLAIVLFIISFVESSKACMELPKKIRAIDTSYSDEVFEFSTATFGPQIQVNNNAILFHPQKKQWCINEKNELNCVEDGSTLDLFDKTEKKLVGIIQVVKNSLIFWSVDAKGNEIKSNPYWKITAEHTIESQSKGDFENKNKGFNEYLVNYSVESINRRKKVDGQFNYQGKKGVYNEKGHFLSTGPKTRGGVANISNSSSEPMVIRGSKISAIAGCGGKVQIDALSGGSLQQVKGIETVN